MNYDIIRKILAVIMIACALYTFDYADFNKTCVCILLILNGTNVFIEDSRFDTIRAISKWCRRAMYLVIAILITKLLIWGF